MISSREKGTPLILGHGVMGHPVQFFSDRIQIGQGNGVDDELNEGEDQAQGTQDQGTSPEREATATLPLMIK